MSKGEVLFRGARVVTLAEGDIPRRGAAMRELSVLDEADVLVRDRVIAAIGVGLEAPGAEVVDADGRVLMPAFVDCHTHACWAGSRLDEWEAKLAGASYLDLMARGGGIMSTVRAVREASEEELTADLLDRLGLMLEHGTTAVEIKSGYGLTTIDELKMLRAIAKASESWPGDVTPTACIGHAIDPDQPEHVECTIDETLPAVAQAFPGITIDAYCETGAWSLEQCVRLFGRARELGCQCRIHADQFNALGMTSHATSNGFASVDHLEASTPGELRVLAQSDTFGVMLPCSGFHLDDRYADGRAFVDAGGALAIATNDNPGSAPCHSMAMAIALAVRKLGLTPAEAVTAATVNPARLLGLSDRVIRESAPADLVLLSTRDERDLAFEFGANPVRAVWVGGALVAGRYDRP